MSCKDAGEIKRARLRAWRASPELEFLFRHSAIPRFLPGQASKVQRKFFLRRAVANAAPRKQIRAIADVTIVVVAPRNKFQIAVFGFHLVTSRMALRTCFPDNDAHHRRPCRLKSPPRQTLDAGICDASLCRRATTQSQFAPNPKPTGEFFAAFIQFNTIAGKTFKQKNADSFRRSRLLNSNFNYDFGAIS